MKTGSQFVGGPLDGSVRVLANEADRVYFPVRPNIAKMIRNPGAPYDLVDLIYEKRAGGAYYEYVGEKRVAMT